MFFWLLKWIRKDRNSGIWTGNIYYALVTKELGTWSKNSTTGFYKTILIAVTLATVCICTCSIKAHALLMNYHTFTSWQKPDLLLSGTPFKANKHAWPRHRYVSKIIILMFLKRIYLITWDSMILETRLLFKIYHDGEWC